MPEPLFRTAAELNARPELFRVPDRSDEENRGPFVVVEDDFSGDPDAIRALALVVENRYNRLVLFREQVLHRAEKGFGSTLGDGRMSQTFFFRSTR